MCIYIEREGQRERDRDRETDRDTERETETETERQKHRQTDTDRQILSGKCQENGPLHAHIIYTADFLFFVAFLRFT